MFDKFQDRKIDSVQYLNDDNFMVNWSDHPLGSSGDLAKRKQLEELGFAHLVEQAIREAEKNKSDEDDDEDDYDDEEAQDFILSPPNKGKKRKRKTEAPMQKDKGREKKRRKTTPVPPKPKPQKTVITKQMN